MCGAAAILLCAAGSPARAQQPQDPSTTQTVGLQAPAYTPFAEVSINGSAPTLVAYPWAPATSRDLTYSVRTSEVGLNIVGSVEANMPPGTTLAANLAAPPGANSLGPVNLSMAPQTLVSRVSKLDAAGLALTYTFTTSGPFEPFTRTVTFSLVPGP